MALKAVTLILEKQKPDYMVGRRQHGEFQADSLCLHGFCFLIVKKHIIFSLNDPSELVKACYVTPFLVLLNHLCFAYFEVVDVH